jgi:hypothetical protein
MNAENHETNKVSEICSDMRVENFDFKVNNRKLANTLELNNDQIEPLENVMEMFSNDMMFAYYECNNTNRDNVIRNSFKKHIQYIGYILNKEQMKKYMTILNVTLANRGYDTSKL